ncbi:hypothetical protein [uncultured Pontibacter sp.]|uniref:hypothetical protein n=1 Tax=uncultured Pontibacter sp. TaxID=453356 RepID=UPI00261F54EB|nr:hypothetical protein [uncultured Pontibacter sp.]
MSQFSNILPDVNGNKGGHQLCFYVPADDVAGWPAANGLVLQGDIQLKPGKVWYLLGYTRHTSSYEHKLKPDFRGGLYSLEQGGFLPTDSPALGSQLLRMKGRRFVLAFKDYNGYLRVTPPGHSLTFSEKFDSQDSPSGLKGYDITFEGAAPLPALYYSGGMQVSELGMVAPPIGNGGAQAPVTIRYNGSIVKLVQPGEELLITSDFTLDFEVKFI